MRFFDAVIPEKTGEVVHGCTGYGPKDGQKRVAL